MKFPKDNKIVYGQDFGWYAGVPSDVDFEVEDVSENRITLVADGYGRLNKKDKYGNGSIVVYLRTSEQFSGDPKTKAEITKNTLIKKFEEIIKIIKED